jgi:hypothetical protein
LEVLAWDRHKKVAGLNWLMGSHISPLDNWISNGNTNINKPTQRFVDIGGIGVCLMVFNTIFNNISVVS